MSANLVIDVGATCQTELSIASVNGVGSSPASGTIIGRGVDMMSSDTYTNLFVIGGQSLSGGFRVAVQTADQNVSGNYTDPTSGLPRTALPTFFLSGGVFIAASGAGNSSGSVNFAAFQRPHRWARAVVLSGGAFNAPVEVGFLAQLLTTGSGGGFSFSPGSGVVNV